MAMINQTARILSGKMSQIVTITRAGVELIRPAVVMTVSNTEVALLPEQERHLPHLKTYTMEPMERGDILDYNGLQWTPSDLQDWTDYGYYRVIWARHYPTSKFTGSNLNKGHDVL